MARGEVIDATSFPCRTDKDNADALNRVRRATGKAGGDPNKTIDLTNELTPWKIFFPNAGPQHAGTYKCEMSYDFVCDLGDYTGENPKTPPAGISVEDGYATIDTKEDVAESERTHHSPAIELSHWAKDNNKPRFTHVAEFEVKIKLS